MRDIEQSVDGISEYESLTFLYTDVEGSTRLWSDCPGIAAEWLRAQEDIIRREIGARRGLVFRSTGDGLCAAFADTARAVACALSIQQSLSQTRPPGGPDFRVRVALATGPVTGRGGEYYGAAPHVVARLLDLCHGGQILLSEESAKIVESMHLQECTLNAVGSHYLKGLKQPVTVFQLSHSSIQAEFPPLRSIKAASTNIPEELNAFVGRRRELRLLDEAFGSSRLVTLLGPGGIGKTRLACKWASQRRRYDGVWFVSLAALTEPTLVAQTIARTLGIVEEPGCPTVSTLCLSLRATTTLIVLDNCEHVLIQCAGVVEHLLSECRNVQVLATSREPLAIPGERHLRLDPLYVYLGDLRAEIDEIAATDAVRLFVDRAVAVRPGFELNSRNILEVLDICGRLDGIPLAIELAAARVRSMPIEQLATRLEAGLTLLRATGALPDRQATLEGAVRWSFNLLTADELTVLRRISVFSGGFLLEAAEDVCGYDGIDRSDVLQLVSNLVDKSLVQFSSNDEQARYAVLEAIRQYAYGDLARAGQASYAIKQHARWAVHIAEAIEEALWGDQANLVQQIDAEMPNFRAVMKRSLEEIDSEYGIRVCTALYRYWTVRGSFKEPVDWLCRLLAIPNVELSPEVEAIAHSALGGLARSQGDLDLSLTSFEHSLDIARRINNARGIADCLNNLGLLSGDLGNLDDAAELLSQSLELERGLHDQVGVSACLINLGVLALTGGRLDEAKGRFEESLQLDNESGDDWGVAASLDGLGRTVLSLGDSATARQHIESSLSIRSRLNDKPGIVESLEAMASVLAIEGKYEDASILIGAAMDARDRDGFPLPGFWRRALAELIADLASALGDDRYAALTKYGAERGIDSVVESMARHNSCRSIDA